MDNVSFNSNVFKNLTEQADESQLQTEISNLLEDKQALANIALNHFSQWDKDKDDSVSITELSAIVLWELSSQQRAAARILAENFNSASNLSVANLPQEVEEISLIGREFMNAAFAGDSKDGISRNDLNVLASVSKKDGLAKMTHDLQVDEKRSAGIHGAYSSAFGIFALVSLIRMFKNPSSGINILSFWAYTAATAHNAEITLEAINNEDDTAMKELFETKANSVSRWDV